MVVVDAVQLCVLHGSCNLVVIEFMYYSNGNQTRPIPRIYGGKSGVCMQLLDAHITMSARAQPQINPLRASETPHSVIMTGLLGTLASSTA